MAKTVNTNGKGDDDDEDEDEEGEAEDMDNYVESGLLDADDPVRIERTAAISIKWKLMVLYSFWIEYIGAQPP